MTHIFRFTLLTAAAACIAACSTGAPTTAEQAAAQNNANNFANSLARSLPGGAVTDANGQPIPASTTPAQQNNLVQALLAQQHQNLTPAQQAALHQYIGQHPLQQPAQQQGVFNKTPSVFNNNNPVFQQNTAIWNNQATATNNHPFAGMHHFFHNLFSPTPATSTPATPNNTSTALPWKNGFSAY